MNLGGGSNEKEGPFIKRAPNELGVGAGAPPTLIIPQHY